MRFEIPAMTFGLALMAGLLGPSSASAQLRLIPQGGLYASVSDLGTVDSAEGAREVGEHESSLALGLVLDMRSAQPLGFRLTGLYGSDSEVPVEGVGCSGSECELRTTLLGLSASVVYRPLRSGFPIRPYLLGGGGLKRYDFDPGSDSVLEDAFDDESKASAVWGVGFDWDLWILKGNLELTDYVSGSILEDGPSQHDFFLMIGVILG